jgi:hypothetical protein
MSLKQAAYGLAPKPRAKKLSVQIQAALDDAVKAKNADPSTQDLIKARLRTLERLADRKLRKKIETLNKQLAAAQAEIERLKAASQQALAVKPASARPLSAVEIALQNYEQEKNGGVQ